LATSIYEKFIELDDNKIVRVIRRIFITFRSKLKNILLEKFLKWKLNTTTDTRVEYIEYDDHNANTNHINRNQYKKANNNIEDEFIYETNKKPSHFKNNNIEKAPNTNIATDKFNVYQNNHYNDNKNQNYYHINEYDEDIENNNDEGLEIENINSHRYSPNNSIKKAEEFSIIPTRPPLYERLYKVKLY
jgi:Arc/MetJ family transcription regulator